ncbi:MAG: serine--tRNA ligase [Euryarchaeota archaeon]|jgi:seryl-tRNA synthetase|uniref:Serine--tRNA ligase n=1 Tax=uncultured marine group II/III euryarchaeote KM3_159_E01 TaxID=1457908 RepID=A0A075GLU3_9EURY|nr:seryl-tRNA synthetase (SARS, serS) [uncultured marine group II/III euryarchaeote KM3_159_E01]MBL80618.1 serine--tRNA ligase [Euryarchaeota archaeon]|tara:strand:+ start:6111 stop:7391 length:1281 start_codon:yes stop_codon:yes gene_type:complete
MLDINIFREHADDIRADHDRRGLPHDAIDEVISLDEQWRKARYDADQLRKARNEAARGIAEAKKSGNSAAAEAIMAEVADIGARIDELAELSDDCLVRRDSLRMSIPNILHVDVPIGEDDQKNTLHSMHGEKAELGFEPRNHNDLIEMNGWVDQSRGAKVAGSRFYFLQGDLARLEMALQQYGADFLMSRGYTLVQPPLMMNREAYEGVTDLADFETVMYGIEPDKYYLIATSEHPLTAMRMDEIIEPSELPIKLVGVSACFRREVGAHGLSDRGIWRVHQFTKVEQIVICDPDNSWDHHEELLGNAVDMWDSLGLHYRVVNICTGDMGTVAARKYDLEAWLPGAGGYKEVVSCSNCTDYQANRLRMRYRTTEGNEAVHTLNSTAIATSRALVAIMEQNQMEDGRVSVPDVLRSYMGGQEVLEPLL